MKTLTTIFVLSSLLLFSTPVMAGSGHEHGHSHAQTPVSQATAEIKATKIVASLVEKNKIAKSWSAIKASSVEKKEFGRRSEWVATFINEKIADANKQKLYVFLTIGGKYIAINYTGN